MKDHGIPEPAPGGKPGDSRLPAELSIPELMSGEGCGRYSDLYEMALLDRLREASAKAAFKGSDPVEDVLADLPGIDWLATDEVLGKQGIDAGEGASHRSVVIETPDTFVYNRYVLSFLKPPPEYFSPVIIADNHSGRKAAEKAWLEEQPVFIDSSRQFEAPLEASERGNGKWRFTRRINSLLKRSVDDLEDPSDEDIAALECWYEANPGSREYQRRLGGYWHLQPAGYYLVDMGFTEDISTLDFGGPDGLIWLYPKADSCSESGFTPPEPDHKDPSGAVIGAGLDQMKEDRSFDPHAGSISVGDCEEALALASVMSERLNSAGIVCEPTVEITEPGAGPFELYPPWREFEVMAAMDLEAELGRPPHKDFFPGYTPREHRVLGGLSGAVPAQSEADTVLRAADYYLVEYQYAAELERRLADGRVPERRKEVLRRRLTESRESMLDSAKRLDPSVEATAGLLASLKRERDVLHETLQHVHGCSALLDEGLARSIESGLKKIQEYRSGERSYYGHNAKDANDRR